MSLREVAVALLRQIDQARSADLDPLDFVENQLRLVRHEGICEGGKQMAKVVDSALDRAVVA